ncbi:MAG: ChaN family lipoprotein [Thermoguttaceae bacterium]
MGSPIMFSRRGISWAAIVAVTVMSLVALSATAADRPLLWIDACEGEPAEYAQIVDDLGTARVVYLGERHTLARHHDTQAKLIADLARGGASLVVALEPLETSQQPSVDRYNRGDIDFDGLAAAFGWAKRWPNYKQYRPVLEAARKAKAPVIGLSPSPEVIHAVVRAGGVDRLDSKLRKQLPADMDFKDPVYEKFLAAQLMVHMAASPERLRPMIEAQIARDEAMSAALADCLHSEAGRSRKAVVVCGTGHVAYGLGTPQRVRHRLGDSNDRIVVLAECGDVRLSPEEKAVARPVEITHEQLRQIGRPVADYLEVACPSGK